MKNIKYIALLFVATLAITSCDNADLYTLDSFENGGFVKFMETPQFRIGTDPSTAVFEGMVEDPNGNVVQYDIFIETNADGIPDDTRVPFRSTTTFPIDVGFNMDDMATAFGVDVSTFEENDDFFFFGIVTLDDGRVYDSTSPDYDETDGYNGGLTEPVLISAAGLLNAMEYRVRLREPL